VAVSRGPVVVKVGGELIEGPRLAALAEEVRGLAGSGHRVTLVHGGGPQASDLQKRLGQQPVQVGGRRVTDAATLDVMKMVVAGKLNMDLCGALNAAGVKTIGLHGASGGAIRARRRPPRVIPGGGDVPVDLGLVGDVTGFNVALFTQLAEAGYVIALACVGADDTGQALNINADTVAAELAAALIADALVLVTGVPGVLRDAKDPSSRIPRLTVAEARTMMTDGSAKGGMIVKLDEALAALGRGVGRVVVVGDLRPGDLARALREPGTVGTAIAN
jgi:acetylglutamate kinase